MIPVWSGEIALFCKRVLNAESRQTGNTFEVITVCSLDSLQEGGLAFSKRVFKEEEYGRPLPEHFVLLAPYGSYSKTGMLITVDNPRLAFAKVVTEFFTQHPAAGIHPTAVVDPSAKVHALATVGPFCFIGPRCVVGEGSVLHSHVVLANDVTIGIHCTLLSNSVLGETGFGIEVDEDGNLFSIPHTGGVVVGDHVQLGSLNSVASGTILPTTIGDYTKTDNLVHIAHNVQVGKSCQITACVEISGSVTIRDRVWLSPNCSIMQKIEIGEGALVGLGAAVTKSVPAQTVVAGVPAKVIKKLGMGVKGD